MNAQLQEKILKKLGRSVDNHEKQVRDRREAAREEIRRRRREVLREMALGGAVNPRILRAARKRFQIGD
jgi:hypothetical protein